MANCCFCRAKINAEDLDTEVPFSFWVDEIEIHADVCKECFWQRLAFKGDRNGTFELKGYSGTKVPIADSIREALSSGPLRLAGIRDALMAAGVKGSPIRTGTIAAIIHMDMKRKLPRFRKVSKGTYALAESVTALPAV